MSVAKIWRNRIEAGTKKLSNCPAKYRDEVVFLIQEDLENGDYTIEQLRQLVESGMMTEEEFAEITGENFE